jgi:plasmid stability protein
MAQFVVRNLDEDVKLALQRRARAHGRSMEEEVRQLLRQAVHDTPGAVERLGSRMAARFAGRGLDEPLPELHGQVIDPFVLDR